MAVDVESMRCFPRLARTTYRPVSWKYAVEKRIVMFGVRYIVVNHRSCQTFMIATSMAQSQSATLSVPVSWQPNDPAAPVQNQDVAQLLETANRKLEAANRKIDFYIHWTASLSAELEQYRDAICASCREAVLLAPNRISESSLRQSGVTSTSSETVIPVGPSDPESVSIGKTKSEHSSPTALSLRSHGPDCCHSPSCTATAQPAPGASNTSRPDLPFSISSAPPPPVDYNPEIKQILVLSVANIFAFTAEVLCVKFSRDGKYLAVALENEETHIYDMVTMTKSVLVEHKAPWKVRSNLWTVQFSPDSKYIATGGRDGQIKIWGVKRERVRATFKGHTSLIRCIDFSPDGRFLASASFDDTVRMWHVRDGSSKCLSCAAAFDFNSVAFSPDGRYVVAGNDDTRLRIWDAHTGHLLKRWEGHTDIVRSVAFKPDGKGIASGGNDHTWKSWDLGSLRGGSQSRLLGHEVNDEAEKEIFTAEGHTDSVTSISFSHDSRWVVTASSSLDCTSRIWDASTGLWVCTLKGHRKCIWAADFSPAGRYLVTGATDCQVMLWRYELDE